MYKNKKIIVLIPARKGSKGLPRKNIKNINGKPLIVWSILAAKESKYIDEVHISSDDEEILPISQEYGCIFHHRPEYLANDTATNLDVVNHFLFSSKNEAEYFILLQPTSPLRKSEHIDEAIELLFEKDTPYIISVCEAGHNPNRMHTIGDDLNMNKFLCKKSQGKNRQEFEKYYRINGAIYIAKIELFKQDKTFLTDQTIAYRMSKESSIDIDNILDFKFAEFLMREDNG